MTVLLVGANVGSYSGSSHKQRRCVSPNCRQFLTRDHWNCVCEREKAKMKMTWKKKSGNKRVAVSQRPSLPFETEVDDTQEESEPHQLIPDSNQPETKPLHDSGASLADAFLQQGNKLAEEGKYREALGKWETAITLMPEKAALHEQKAQVLLEVGDAWGALKAATRATQLDPSWAEAWITLGRAQLNFGEPDCAIESFDKALAIKSDLGEAQDDRQTALQLVKKRKHLHLSGVSTNSSRYQVRDGSQTQPS